MSSPSHQPVNLAYTRGWLSKLFNFACVFLIVLSEKREGACTSFVLAKSKVYQPHVCPDNPNWEFEMKSKSALHRLPFIPWIGELTLMNFRFKEMAGGGGGVETRDLCLASSCVLQRPPNAAQDRYCFLNCLRNVSKTQKLNHTRAPMW